VQTGAAGRRGPANAGATTPRSQSRHCWCGGGGGGEQNIKKFEKKKKKLEKKKK
jgi:hypothetical protein